MRANAGSGASCQRTAVAEHRLVYVCCFVSLEPTDVGVAVVQRVKAGGGTPSAATTVTVEKATRACRSTAPVRSDTGVRTDGCRPTRLASFQTCTAIVAVSINKLPLQY